MAENTLKNNNKNEKGNRFFSGRFGFLNILSLVILFFLFLSGIYAEYQSSSSKKEEVSLSTLAYDISKGNVLDVKISGNDITSQYKDGTIKVSQKESDSSLTESLTRFGVSQAKLASTTISITSPSGFWYWTGALAPFLAPILYNHATLYAIL